MKTICMFALLGVVSLSALAKQETVMIEIRGDTLTAPLEITDARVVRQFSVWNGPGTRSWDGDGNLNPPAHLDPNKVEGRFVDWPKGMAKERPANLRLFDVTFYLGRHPTQRQYAFTYAVDPTSNRGFIYLLPTSTNVIFHGVEGNWFYASQRWDELISPRVLATADWPSTPTPRIVHSPQGISNH